MFFVGPVLAAGNRVAADLVALAGRRRTMANIIRRNERDTGNLTPRARSYYEPPLRGGVLDPFRMIGELLRWDPFGEFDRGTGFQGGTFAPSVNVRETTQSFVFRADLPGVKEDNVEILLTGNRLTISGHREDEKREETDRYHAYESSYGSFARSFTLPEGTDSEHVRAEMKDGILEVTVPKRPEIQPRRIEVGQKRTGDGGKSEAKS
jgi:HSP20 family protein